MHLEINWKLIEEIQRIEEYKLIIENVIISDNLSDHQ